jgi:hypothetical protein
MNPFGRVLGACSLGALAFVSGAATDPASAGAHCGAHANSCHVWSYVGTHCVGGQYWEQYESWDGNCSGTCYNGGQDGCCESPEACGDAPCKPGGCTGPCAYYYTEDRNPFGSC